MAGQAASKVLRFVAAIFLARFLSPSAFGIFNVGIAISGVLVMASSLGLPEIGSRTVAADPGTRKKLLVPVLVGRLSTLIVGSAGFALVAFLAWPNHMFFCLATIAMALAMTLTPDWLARGLERMGVVGLATTLGSVIACGGAALLAPIGSSELALLVFAAGEATVALVCFWGIAPQIRPLSTDLSGLGTLVKRAWPLGIAAVVTYSYYANVDTVILASFRSAHEAGIYSAAYRVFWTFNVVPIFAAYATFPILSRLAAAHANEEAQRTLFGVLGQLAGYGILVVGFVEVAGRLTLSVLFGEAFVGAAPTFTLLAVAAAWYAVGYGSGYSLIAAGNTRGFVEGALAAGALCLGLDLALIPRFGMTGAGTATVVAFVAATAIWLLRQQLGRANTSALMISLLVTSLGAVVTLLAPATNFAIGLATCALGVASFLLALWRHRISGPASIPSSAKSVMLHHILRRIAR
jgi:PST family polysaccharide transporter